MDHTAALSDYERFDFDDGRWTRPVWKRGSGPAAIIIHEMPGLHPLVIRFGDHVAAAGMTVYLPSLFGDPGRPVTPGYAIGELVKGMCVRKEFSAWATDRSSPIVDWLRVLAKKVHGDCGGPGVAALGMCFTGNFALAMMTEPSVIAPVLSQPSLPLTLFGKEKRKGAMGVTPAEIACAKGRFEAEDLSMIGLRFKGDPFLDESRFDSFKRTFGERFEAIELEAEDARQGTGVPPHSVLTIHLRDDDPDSPTKKAEARVIQFFRQRLGLEAQA